MVWAASPPGQGLFLFLHDSGTPWEPLSNFPSLPSNRLCLLCRGGKEASRGRGWTHRAVLLQGLDAARAIVLDTAAGGALDVTLSPYQLLNLLVLPDAG